MNKTSSGFTIVELLVVIVVIAILAAVTVVAYNGFSVRAKNAVIESKVDVFQKAIENFHTINSRYPGSWEMRGTTGAELIGLSADDLDIPDEAPGWNGIYCWFVNDLSEKSLCYISQTGLNGVGWMCDPPDVCRSYKIEYVDRVSGEKIVVMGSE